MDISLEDYLAALESAASRNRTLWFPHSETRRIERNLYLARNIGSALIDYSLEDIKRVLNRIYIEVLVENSLDDIGVVISNCRFRDTILESREHTLNTIKQAKERCNEKR